jgi:hypothetical protein
MNIHDEMTDNEILRTAASSLSALPVAAPPDAKAIMARGRTRRHYRRAGVGLAGTAVAAVSAIGVASVLAGGPAPASATGTIHTLAFTLAKNHNGSVMLTLTQDQVFNPDALQQALAQDGIPALVQTDTWCTSNPAGGFTFSGSAGTLNQILSIQLPDGSPVTGPPGQQKTPVPPDAVTVIYPAAIPAGTELFFDYQNNDHGLTGDLLNIGSYTCTSGIVPWLPSSSHHATRP